MSVLARAFSGYNVGCPDIPKLSNSVKTNCMIKSHVIDQEDVVSILWRKYSHLRGSVSIKHGPYLRGKRLQRDNLPSPLPNYAL